MDKIKNHLAGYRLHLKRLEFPDPGTSIRTIKYPLGNYHNIDKKIELSDKELAFATKIKQDYESLYGSFNLTSYVKFRNQKPKHYSVKDFYLDLLKSGAIMKHSAAKLLEDLRLITKEQQAIDNRQKRLMREKNLEFFNEIVFEEFKKEILKSKEIRSTKKSFGFFKKDSSKSQEITERLLSNLRNKTREEQNAYWQDNYGVQKSLYQTPDKGISFYLIPDIKFRGNQAIEPLEVLDSYEEDLSKCFDNKNIKIEEFIGTSDDCSGLSQAFGKILSWLREGELEMIKQKFFNISNVWRGKELELDRRLKFLSNQSKRLRLPQLVKTWSDYRTDFGGKIQSWVSNSLRQNSSIAKFLFGGIKKELKSTKYTNERTKSKAPVKDRTGGNKSELKKVAGLLVSDLPKGRYNKSEDLRDAQQLARRLQNHLSDFEKKYDPEKGFDFDFLRLEDYRDILAQLRTKLNLLYQSSTLDEESTDKNTKFLKIQKVNKIYKSLFSNLPEIPSFIGDTKSSQGGIYDKYLDSLNRLKTGINFLVSKTYKDFTNKTTGKDQTKQIERLKDSLQKILNLYRRTDKQFSKSIQIIEKTLNQFVDVEDLSNLKSNQSDHYIFQSKYKKRPGDEKKQLILKLDDDELLKQIPYLLNKLAIKWNQYASPSNYLKEWLVFIELEKIRLGLLCQMYDVSAIAFDDKLLRQKFLKIDVILDRFSDGDKNSNQAINEVIQQAILSEMRGTISKMTTNFFIARYVVQPIDSEKKFSIMTNASTYGNFNNKNPKYFIRANPTKNNDAADSQELYSFKNKKIDQNVLSKKPQSVAAKDLLPLQSSKYQLQFLNNALSSKWSNFKPTIASYSFIYEEKVKVSWIDDSQEPLIQKIEDSESLFVSIPFQLTGSSQNPIDLGNKFLGIDMGEYGLATCLLDVNRLDKKPLMFFIHSRPLRKIKIGISSNIEKQKAGIFSAPNTYVKRLRKDAITSIRNKAHWLVIKHKAIPVYEASVSNFETKSGRVSKIYNSVKQSDIYRQTNINNLERALVWGKQGRIIKPPLSQEISAYATSYSCSKCYRSIYALDLNQPSYEITQIIRESENSRTLKIKLDNEYILGFLETKKTQKVKEKSLNPEEVIRAARKYARPPYNNNFNEIFSKQDFQKIENHYKRYKLDARNKEKPTNPNPENKARIVLSHYAGSQAIFRCPFADCGHIADADFQAALWIALKGYVKYIWKIGNPKNQKTKKRDLKPFEKEILRTISVNKKSENSINIPVDGLLKFAKQSKIPAIKFIYSKRLLRLPNKS